jgi:hypothetical protein
MVVNRIDPVTGRVPAVLKHDDRRHFGRVADEISRERGWTVEAHRGGGRDLNAEAERNARLRPDSAWARARGDQQLVAGLQSARSWTELHTAADRRGWELRFWQERHRGGLVLVDRQNEKARVGLSKVAGGDYGISKVERRFGAACPWRPPAERDRIQRQLDLVAKSERQGQRHNTSQRPMRPGRPLRPVAGQVATASRGVGRAVIAALDEPGRTR